MKKNTNKIYYALGFAVLLAGGFWFWNQQRKKPIQPTPPPLPPLPPLPPTPQPLPLPPAPGVNAATYDQIKTLQTFINKRYSQLKKENEFPVGEIDGGYKNLKDGGKTAKALQALLPLDFAAKGDVNANNVQFYIDALKKIVDTGTSEINKQQTTQTTQQKNLELAKQYAAHFNSGKNLQTTGEIDFALHKFDRVQNRMVFLDKREKIKAGTILKKGGKFTNAEPRLTNGQIMFYDSKGIAYIANPINLLAL